MDVPDGSQRMDGISELAGPFTATRSKRLLAAAASAILPTRQASHRPVEPARQRAGPITATREHALAPLLPRAHHDPSTAQQKGTMACVRLAPPCSAHALRAGEKKSMMRRPAPAGATQVRMLRQADVQRSALSGVTRTDPQRTRSFRRVGRNR
jgi:hypothetical protein